MPGCGCEASGLQHLDAFWHSRAPARCSAWSLLGRSGLGGRGEGRGGRGKPYVHPQHMPAVKPRPPGPSRVGARRHGEVLAEERAGSRPCCPEGGSAEPGAFGGAVLGLPERTGRVCGGGWGRAGLCSQPCWGKIRSVWLSEVRLARRALRADEVREGWVPLPGVASAQSHRCHRSSVE